MNHRVVAGCVFCYVLFANTTFAETLQGRVVRVADGDTVTVLDESNTQFKIRLMGIDAPEKKQPFGTKSKESLSGLVFNKQVAVEYKKRDKYGRIVGKILVDGVDANLEQIKVGLAWHYKKYVKEQPVADRATYSQSEVLAKAERRGLWIDPNPTSPWYWRKLQKQMH